MQLYNYEQELVRNRKTSQILTRYEVYPLLADNLILSITVTTLHSAQIFWRTETLFRRY